METAFRPCVSLKRGSRGLFLEGPQQAEAGQSRRYTVDSTSLCPNFLFFFFLKLTVTLLPQLPVGLHTTRVNWASRS